MWEGKGLVSFEGSSGILAWIRNLDFEQKTTGWDQCAGCQVHEGFLDEYNTMESCIKSSLQEIGAPTGSTIRTTGHSLGAALNNFAMLDLEYSGWHIEESYDFGKPRTGDADFAAAWNSKFSNIAFRVTHHRDPVPQVPPDDVGGAHFDWEHVQPEIWYEGDVSSGYQECDEPHKTTCAEQYWDVPFNILFEDSVDDHLHYFDLDICGCPNSGSAEAVV
jgi:predicted lipase